MKPDPPVAAEELAFGEVVEMIRVARTRNLAVVNTALIDLYGQVGQSISRRIETERWGKNTVHALAAYIQHRQPGTRGFSAQNRWRMRPFFDAYRDPPILSTLLRELPWSSNLPILNKSKRPEGREFSLRLARQERWSVRELALDRDVRKPNERPPMGVLLCASKNSEVVEYALSRSLSPALVAEYQTQLPDKSLLQAKLYEFYALSAPLSPKPEQPKDGTS